jgi:hypothetical protein
MAYDVLVDLQNGPNGTLLDEPYFAVLLKAILVHGASWAGADSVIQEVLADSVESARFREYVTRFLGYGGVDLTRLLGCTNCRATILGCGSLSVDEGHLYRVPLPRSLSGRAVWRRLIVTLAWFTPINCKHRKYRKAALYFDFPLDDVEQTVGTARCGADWQAVRRGTVQHEIFEGEYATAYSDEDTLAIRVNCREDAGKLGEDEQIHYGIAVTLEVGENNELPIYDEIRTRMQIPVGISTPS